MQANNALSKVSRADLSPRRAYWGYFHVSVSRIISFIVVNVVLENVFEKQLLNEYEAWPPVARGLPLLRRPPRPRSPDPLDGPGAPLSTQQQKNGRSETINEVNFFLTLEGKGPRFVHDSKEGLIVCFYSVEFQKINMNTFS